MRYSRSGGGYATITTTEGKERCDEFFEKTKEEWKDDPNNIPYEFVETIDKKEVEVPPKYVIYKRRQKTKDGDPDPRSPCDDKGLPLYIDDEGALTTNRNGNEIAWGEWIDATKEGVSIDQLHPPKRCRPEKIRVGRWEASDEDIEKIIENDQRLHDAQQASRKNKIHVDYKHEKVKDKSSYPEWTCTIKKKRSGEFPSGWKDASYDPLQAPIGFPIPVSFSRYKISEKTGKQLSAKTGVGNFKGRTRVEKELRSGKIFGMYVFDNAAQKAGFTPERSYFDRGNWTLDVPGTDDACVIKTSRRDFPFVSTQFFIDRLRSPEGKIPISGYFLHGDFEIHFKNDAFYSSTKPYKEKAPGKSVDFCKEKFDEVVKDSIVKLKPVI